MLRGMSLAALAASWSKAPTKNGACLISGDFRSISMGYNGLPRGVPDVEEALANPAIRAASMVHAELNAILNARFSAEGCAIFSTGFPCAPCASAIINAGIVHLFAPGPIASSRWAESQGEAARLLGRAHVFWTKLAYEAPSVDDGTNA